MPKLSVIIPFLNEGVEVFNTVKSIKDTANIDIDIILINDASTDRYDYKSVATEFNAQYIIHSERKGVAASRDEGVSIIKTPYFLLLDGHMRFTQSNWASEILNTIKANERAIYCLQCKPLLPKFTHDNSKRTIGACINMSLKHSFDILEPFWKFKDTDPDNSIVEIPCILGAAYIASKKYWEYIKGLRGLRTYGCDESFISLKTWLEGGKCFLIKDIIVEHLFREDHPFNVDWSDRIYNKLVITLLILPPKHKKNIFKNMYIHYPNDTIKAMSLLAANKDLIIDLKDYLQKIFTWDFDSFQRFNESQM